MGTFDQTYIKLKYVQDSGDMIRDFKLTNFHGTAKQFRFSRLFRKKTMEKLLDHNLNLVFDRRGSSY